MTSELASYLGSQAVDSYYEDWDVVENRYKDKYIYYLEEVVQEDGSEKEVDAVTGHSFHQFKGSLTFYYFDQRIKEETDGEKDLSDALQYLFIETLKGRNKLNEDLLVEALYNIVEEGIDFKEKVRGYMMGDHPGYEHKFLDLSDYIDVDPSDYGIDPEQISIGISVYPDIRGDEEKLLKSADEALYEAKGEEYNKIQIGTSK